MAGIGIPVNDYFSSIGEDMTEQEIAMEIVRIAMLTAALIVDVQMNPNRSEMYIWN